MPKRPCDRFPLPGAPESETMRTENGRRRPMSASEALERRAQVERLAKAGDPEALVELARRLLTESPDAERNRRARRLLERALESDNPRALYLTGLMKLRGQGYPQNQDEGARCVLDAAYAGVPEAEADAARLARDGIGQPVSPKNALYWWRLAAARGLTEAEREAGRAYRDGIGTEKNYAEASKWLTAAAEKGDAQAQYELALLNLRRDHPTRDHALARRWMREAALSGIVPAQYRLGVFYWSGTGGSVNLRQATRWLVRAAEAETQGSGQALSTLAGFFLTGNVFELNRLNAWILLKRARELGDLTAEATAKGLQDLLDPSERTAGRELLRLHRTKALLDKLLVRVKL